MTSLPREEDVLNAFAVEPDHDALTIQRYLARYPQFAAAIIDLSRELSREIVEDAPLSDNETAWVEKTLQQYRNSTAAAPDLFARSTLEQRRAAAQELKVPRQVIAAFAECKILVETIPRRTLRRLAAAFDVTFESLVLAISGPQKSGARSFKADAKPVVGERVSFAQVLMESRVPEDVVSDLLSEEK